MAHVVVPCETIQSCIDALELIYLDALELIYLDVPVTPTTTSPLLRLEREIKQLRALLNRPSEPVLKKGHSLYGSKFGWPESPKETS